MEESLLTPDSDLLDDDLFIKPQKKKKIIFISDHPLAPSGVGVQARFLIEGLVATGKYTFRCLGGAIKHADYRTVKVNDDFIVKPVDGFGSKDLIRNLLITEQPDAIFLFTDPRQFIWLWEIEDEIHQICPIVYWHVWDNDPYPAFNHPWYEATDLINCLSKKTYDLVKPRFPEKTHYIPHAFPKSVYHPLPEAEIKEWKQRHFREKADWFKVLWVNRNATRKVPSDVLESWKHFLDALEEKHGHRDAILIMHTDPYDMEGPNLLAVSEVLGLQNHVWFSTEKLDFANMNILHNCCDTVINIAKNEGFGLSTLIQMQVGKPVIALKTGGETSKVIDSKDNSEHGVAIEPSKRLLVGSQMVPYIYEDFADQKDIVEGLLKIHDMTDEEKEEMREKCINYVDREFNIDDVVNKWSSTMEECITQYNSKEHKRWVLTELKPSKLTRLEDVSTEEKKIETKPVKTKVQKPKKGKKIKTLKVQ